MRKLKKLKLKCKFSADTVYVFSELKKRDKARKAMRFHEMKIAIQVALLILVCQIAMLGIILIF